MDRINYVQVTPALGVGGAEHFVVDLACALSEIGVASHVVSLSDLVADAHREALQQMGVSVETLGKPAGPSMRTVPRLAATLRRRTPTVLHTHRNALRYLAPLLVKYRVPVLHTVHTIPGLEVDRATQALYGFLFRTGSATPVATGGASAEQVARHHRLGEVTAIPNAAWRGRLRNLTPARTLLAELGVPGDSFVVASIGRLVAEKRIDAAIAGFSEFAERLDQHDAVLLIVGDGPEASDLRAKVKCHLKDQIRFLGLRNDVPSLLAAIDVLLVVSEREAAPMTVAEASALGTPTISVQVGDVERMISQVDGSSVLPNRAPGTVAEALESFRRGQGAVAPGPNDASLDYDAIAMANAYLALAGR